MFSYKRVIRLLADTSAPISRKRKLFATNRQVGGFLPLDLPAVLSLIGGLVDRVSLLVEVSETVFFSCGLIFTSRMCSSSTQADGKGKERNRFAGLSLPQPPSASDFMPSAPPLFGGQVDRSRRYFFHSHDSQTQTYCFQHSPL
ncbi:hypothetical protein TNCV_3919821 [Trichonephila clavipes]|nr:hypothetical protein TNCV_3919821 [Trichonephila clavipes]